MDRTRATSNALALAITTAILFPVVAAVMFVLTYVFVSWFRYDYVTVTSLIFMLWSAVTTLAVAATLPRLRHPLEKVSSVLMAVMLPLFVGLSLRLYEGWAHPVRSDHIDAVGWYLALAGAPVRGITHVLTGIWHGTEKTVAWIQQSDLAVAVVGGVLTALIVIPMSRVFEEAWRPRSPS